MPLAGSEWMFQTFALPNYREYLAEPSSVRRAYNAAVSISHMADHIALRASEPTSSQIVRKKFRDQSQAFKIVDDMCNAFKHVHATGGGSAQPIVATTSGMTIAGSERVLFVNEIDGSMQEFRPMESILVFDYFSEGSKRIIWVAPTLYGAVRFIANRIGCDSDVTDHDLPPSYNLVYRRARPETHPHR